MSIKAEIQLFMFENYPKKRIELPLAYKEIYERHYFLNREGNTRATSLSSRLEKWMHKQVARDIRKGQIAKDTLEIGAGTLNHLEWEPINTSYDIVEPFTSLFKDSADLPIIRKVYSDISEIEKDKKYDRIISIATFEHIQDLPEVVARAVKLLSNEGQLRVAIPNEGTVLWKLGTKVTGYEFRKKYGLDYQVLMQYEHVNTADDIEEVLEFFFDKLSVKVFGISKKLAFYRFYKCESPNFAKANEYLK